MEQWNNIPKVDMEMIRYYEAEARRLRAEAIRSFVLGMVASVRKLFTPFASVSVEPRKEANSFVL